VDSHLEALDFDVHALDFDVRALDFDVRALDFDVHPLDFDVRALDFDVRALDFDVHTPDFDVHTPDFDVHTPDFDVHPLDAPGVGRRTRGRVRAERGARMDRHRDPWIRSRLPRHPSPPLDVPPLARSHPSMASDHASLHLRLDSGDFDTSLVQVRRVAGREAISQPFSFEIDLAVTDPAGLEGDKVLGAAASLLFEREGGGARQVHGMIAAFHDLLDTEPEHRTYRVALVPRLHRLTLVETQEVFLDLSIPDILKEKLALVNLGATDVDLRLLDKYPPRDIVVQYRETDLGFVSRLAEHLGVSYFFDHEGGSDRVVFTDHNEGFARIERLSAVPYRGRGERRDVFRIEARRDLVPASYAVVDYDYRAPHLELTSSFEHPAGYAGGVVEYGSHHRTPAEGDRLARVRAEERDVRGRFFVGESDVTELTAGALFELQGHPQLGDRRLLVVEVEHRGAQVAGGHGGDGGEGYANTFRAVDASHPYRPPRVTPRPRIHGLLTAITEPAPKGSAGRVAQIDEQGRYTVRFFFDIAGSEGRQRSSARVRMAQPHAGDGYGIHFPLKPSVEVTVSFVDGDPDRPIIVGAVPNPVTMSPVTGHDPLMNRIKLASGALIEFKDR
jgi:type VI secretion system secreted protein VgrG